MAKQSNADSPPTGKWVQRVFAWFTKPKPSDSQPQDLDVRSQDLLRNFTKMLKSKVDGDTSSSNNMKCRAALVDLIIPEVLTITDGRVKIHGVKPWAMALGQMVGVLAGLGVESGKMNEAIDDISVIAKEYAERIDRSATRVPFDSDPTVVAKSSSVIQDIERQIATETDPAVKAALKAMAETIRITQQKGNAA